MTLFLLLLPALVIAFALLAMTNVLTALVESVRRLVTQFRALTPRQRITSLSIIAGLILVVFLIGRENKDLHLQVLRHQFDFPEDAAVTDVRLSKHSSAKRPNVEAVVRFTEPQFAAYSAKIENPATWRPGFLSYDGVPVVSYSPEALRWTELPGPAFAGQRQLRWGSISRELDVQMHTGKTLCFALQRHEAARPSPDAAGATVGYRARACADIPRREDAGPYVRGALDYDTKTLHMMIR